MLSFNHKSYLKWVLSALAIISVLVIAIIINSCLNRDDASKVSNTIEADNGNSKINWDRYPTYDIELSESLSITEPGTYHLTGSLADGEITINTKNTVVRLILDQVSIKNSTGPAISCYEGDDLVIELVGENTLEDGESYATSYDEDVTGAIYSKADLTFSGTGSLNLTANFEDAIVGKDDVNFNDGIYYLKSADDAIRGKDSVYITNGNFTIESEGDAIKSTNEVDAGKGFVLIENGTFDIKTSGKAIEAINSILIHNGEYTIDSYDDAIHSNNYVGIVDGNIEINSGDDGIHADSELIIDGGNITIEKAYEGLEAQTVTINDGTLNLTTFDDGINAGGGADESASNRPGAEFFYTDDNCAININGGDIYIDASGDGVDSNGWLNYNNGNLVIDGPTNNGNGALDAGLGIIMKGGNVIAVGSSGMAVDLGSSSSVYSISVFFTATQRAGTKIEIRDLDGNVILSHTSTKTFTHLAAGSSALMPGTTYKIFLNDAEYDSFTTKDIVTIIGNAYTNQMMPPGGQNRR